MKHPEKLTATTAERAKPDPTGEYRIGDPEVPGLSLRIRPDGTKAYILRYRTTQGVQRLMTLGRWPDLLVPAARKMARKRRGEVQEGADPLEDRQLAKRGTFKEVADRWLKEYAQLHRKSWAEDKRRLDKHLLPALGSRPVASITDDDVSKVHRRISKGGAQVEANRVVQLARAIFHWARARKLVPASYLNPASGVKRNEEHSRERWLKASEIEKLSKAIRGVEDPIQRAVVQLLLLTGCRVRELLRARWDRLDIEGRRLLLEDTKTGEAKTVTLSTPAVSILKGLPRIVGTPWIFPSPVKPREPLTTIRRTWVTVRSAAGIPNATVHDLRRTAGSWMVQRGVPLQVVGAALGHRDHRSTLVYARIAAEQPGEALELLGDELGSRLMPA